MFSLQQNLRTSPLPFSPISQCDCFDHFEPEKEKKKFFFELSMIENSYSLCCLMLDLNEQCPGNGADEREELHGVKNFR